MIEGLTAQFPLSCKHLDYAEVAQGWKDLVFSLLSTIEFELQNTPNNQEYEVFVSQIKEKFGGLRVYINNSNNFIDGAIRMAEGLSYKICERCGSPGHCRKGGWVRTLCDKHEEERQSTLRKCND
jgi:hypothetical protein